MHSSYIVNINHILSHVLTSSRKQIFNNSQNIFTVNLFLRNVGLTILKSRLVTTFHVLGFRNETG